MSHYCKEYDDNCPGCQPAMMNPVTGEKLADDSPEMIAVMAYWKTLPIRDKQACHRQWCFNSGGADLEVVKRVAAGMSAALAKLGN